MVQFKIEYYYSDLDSDKQQFLMYFWAVAQTFFVGPVTT